MSDRLEVVVTHRFAFSAERVFASWLRPEAIRIWMQAALKAIGLPGDLILVEVDARVGGQFCFSDKRPMGETFHWGTYKQLDFPTNIAFTWNVGLERTAVDDSLSLVTITIEPTDSGSSVRLVHSIDPKWKDYLKRTEDGWKNMLVHIDRSLADAVDSTKS